MAKKIIFLGTGSDVGKSICTTAFCRILKNRGIRVAPFKAQNMSNNSFVTAEGGEIGRAQAAQAEACGLAPSVHMNPVLLKPVTDMGSQVVIQGNVYANMRASDYYRLKQELKKIVMDSFRVLESRYEAIVMEGAGSCCEVNLRTNDIVNFEMAMMSKTPVVLIADIDRGGVFAQIIGTLEVISPRERDMIKGFVINKFRGDPELFRTGIQYIEKRTGKPVYGLVPAYNDIRIDTEDSMSLDKMIEKPHSRAGQIKVGVVRLPHISNFTDLEVLETEPCLSVTWLLEPKELSRYDVIIIPGSKSTIADMKWLWDKQWVMPIRQFAADTKHFVVGLCGGYQILGKEIVDPKGIEGDKSRIEGLGLIDIVTEIAATKIVRLTEGKDKIFHQKVRGYEIHMGKTHLGKASCFLELGTGMDGAVNRSGNVFGAYLHGLFDSAGFREQFIGYIAARKKIRIDSFLSRKDYWLEKEENYDRLAMHFETHLDVDLMMEAMENK